MIRLNAPLWLDATAAAPTGDADGRAVIRFARTLSDLFRGESKLPVGFVEIVRTALAENAIGVPCTLVIVHDDGSEESVAGVGATLDELDRTDSPDRTIERAHALRDLALGFARHVGRLDTCEFDGVVGAVAAKYRTAVHLKAGVEVERSVAVLLARLVEARVGESIPRTAAEQIARLVGAVLSHESGATFRVESVRVREAVPRAGVRGVVFSRDPATGAAGIVTVVESGFGIDSRALRELERRCGEREAASCGVVAARFEARGATVVDFEEVDADAARIADLHVAMDLVRDGVLTSDAAFARFADLDLAAVRVRGVLDDGVIDPFSRGVVVAIGAATGRIALSRERAQIHRSRGDDTVLIVDDPEAASARFDITVANAVALLEGSAHSPVARAARRLGIPCVSVAKVKVDRAAGVVASGRATLREGEFATLDGSSGALYRGVVPIVEFAPPPWKLALHAWRMARIAASGLRPE